MKVEESVRIGAPRGRVWRLLARPEEYGERLAGLTWKPGNGARAGGPEVGSRYDVWTRVGAAQLGGTVEIVERVEGYDLAWVSVRGVDQRGRWRLREHPDGGLELTLRVYYQAPGGWLGVPGLLADLAAARLVRSLVRDWLAAVRRAAESPTKGRRRRARPASARAGAAGATRGSRAGGSAPG